MGSVKLIWDFVSCELKSIIVCVLLTTVFEPFTFVRSHFVLFTHYISNLKIINSKNKFFIFIFALILSIHSAVTYVRMLFLYNTIWWKVLYDAKLNCVQWCMNRWLSRGSLGGGDDTIRIQNPRKKQFYPHTALRPHWLYSVHVHLLNTLWKQMQNCEVLFLFTPKFFSTLEMWFHI